MAAPIQWTWVWVHSGICWWTGGPGMLQSMGSQRVGHNWVTKMNFWASVVAQWVKDLPAVRETWIGDLGSIPGLGKSPGEGKGYPIQYSRLETSMDCIVHGVTKSQTRLSDFHWNLLESVLCINQLLLLSSRAVSDSLLALGLRHTSLLYPSLTPKSPQTHSHWVSDAFQPFHPLLPLFLLPSTFPNIRVFSNELALHINWPKYWSLSFSISPSNDYSGLISFRNDWFDPLSVQGIFKSLLQHHNVKASNLSGQSLFMTE